MMTPELDKLIDLAKQVGSDAWPILVQSEVVHGHVGMAMSVSLGLLALVALVVAWIKWDDDALVIAALVVGAFLFMCSFGVFWDYYPNMVFPEGEALRTLLR